MAKSLVWFRRDLRVQDNPALWHACQRADEGVVAAYLITAEQWKMHDDAAVKVDFWMRNLAELSGALAELNIPLLILNGPSTQTFSGAPVAIRELAVQYDCDKVFWNKEYEVNEAERDMATETELAKKGIQCESFHDRVVIPPHELQTNEGRFYSIFTPYRRAWDSVLADKLKIYEVVGKQKQLSVDSSPIPKQISGYLDQPVRSDLWPAGEREAFNRLQDFYQHMVDYGVNRDRPSINGTSLLSPYLAAGVISPRQCVASILAATGKAPKFDTGPGTWVSELTWRDFYVHVMVGCPRVSMHRPFKLKTDAVAWRNDESDFAAWKNGQTGYPLVDAGMRQLNQTGWMHNRLRMVTAMFLTKNLLIDWRLGERYFMQNLVDGDLSANNGGWQWSASTGTDSVPYFRIFNPFMQSKRFDQEGAFIRTFCPELADVPASALHDVKKFQKVSQDLDYPDYVVEYRFSRERALAAFKAI